MKKKRPIRDFLWRHSFGVAFVVMALFVAFLGYVGWNYVLVARKFDSARRWDLPSRIYSDGTPILPGLTYPKRLLEPKLNHVGYHEVKTEPSNPGEYRFVGDSLEIYLQNFDYPDMEFRGFPVRVEMEKGTVRRVIRMADGIVLRGVRLEPELITSVYDDVMEDRVPVPLQAVPKDLIDAIIAVEDRAFYQHEGISIRGIIRAAMTNFRSGGVRAGGSTLTQQLVKNFYLTEERTYTRKAREAIMAILLELRYSKEEILEAYLNEIYLGQNGAVQINGVEQASQVYFSKRVNYLTLPEAATLAGMIRFPNGYSPLKNPGKAKERRNLALRQMREQGMIDDAEYERAVAAPMTTSKYPRSIRSAPFFVDLVMKQLQDTYPETQLQTEGLRIFTTLDTMMQRSAEEALESGLAGLKKKYSHVRKSPTPVEGVVVTIQPGSGYVKALVGGSSYKTTQFNRALQAKRQPGSLFKPFVYTAAMNPARGDEAMTASTLLDDSPISVDTGGGAPWRPQNYDGRFHGRVTVRRALAHSYNIPAVRAAINAGVPNVIQLASQIGVESKLQAYPSISLGSFEVTPLEIAYAYSVFANEGVKAEPVSILAVATRDGKLLESRSVTMKKVAPAAVCYVMNDILQDVLDYGTAARLRSMGFTRKYAGKTGTTNNYRDAWFIGYSPRLLSLVWIGYDDGRNLRLSGSDAAVPIWGNHMTRVAGLVPDVDFRRPDDVIEREIDPATGYLVSAYCPAARAEVFVRGTEPEDECPVHTSGYLPDPFFRTESDRRAEAEVAEGSTDEAPASADRQEREKERQKREKKGLRRILGWIFD